MWTDSIYNHREEITNEKFEYIFYEDATHNGIIHDSDDPDVVEYRKSVLDRYNALEEKHGGNIPYDEEKAFFNTIDKTKYNAINESTLDEILNFFAKA